MSEISSWWRITWLHLITVFTSMKGTAQMWSSLQDCWCITCISPHWLLFAFLFSSLLSDLCLPWPCLVGVKRKKLRCVFAVRRWRLQQQLPEEAGVEGQYSYWWLLRKKMRGEIRENRGSRSLQFEWSHEECTSFTLVQSYRETGCQRMLLLTFNIQSIYLCECSVQECLMTTLTFIINAKCDFFYTWTYSSIMTNLSWFWVDLQVTSTTSRSVFSSTIILVFICEMFLRQNFIAFKS